MCHPKGRSARSRQVKGVFKRSARELSLSFSDERPMNISSQSKLESLRSKRIYIAGHRGMVGKALIRALKSIDANNLITKTRDELNLCNQADVESFFEAERPDCVLFAAAKVGGIHANRTYPAEFIYENLMMATNAIHAAYNANVERFLFLGSTCIYPRMAPQPMPESCLLSGPLEKPMRPMLWRKFLG